MDFILQELEDISVSKLITWASCTAMIVGGVVPYIPQYRDIKRTENTDGFSLYVCLALLIANTLRILFWFGRKFELPLLIQSIVMNLTMLIMINLCVNVRNRTLIIRGKDRTFTVGVVDTHHGQHSVSSHPEHLFAAHTLSDFDSRYFWAWTDFQSYVEFMLVFSIGWSFLMYLFLDALFFVEMVGFLAVFTEALLGAPQFLRNFENKSTEGMSLKMVVMWTMGDTFKTCYFVARDAPTQFWVCGVLQLSIDIAILGQVYLYRNNTSSWKKKLNSEN